MTIEVPDDALPFILLQRTSLQRLNLRFLRKLGVTYYPRICNWECRIRGAAIRRDFAQSIVEDYEQIRTHLPERVTTILDIGCGVAGIDVALQRHYAAQSPLFRLLDKTAVSSKIFYDFHDAGAFYNSLAAAARILTSNGTAAASVQQYEANEKSTIPLGDASVDLILSLISWGFHYPVATYLQEAARVLAPGGILIMDVRRDSGGLEELRAVFPNLTTIAEQPKFLRLCARR